MHDLTAMRIFVQVAEAGSFAAAARGLGLSTSVVSHHVAKLERTLGAALLRRTTRRIGLTEAGARYLPRASAILDEADALLHEMQNLRSSPAGRLRISVPPGIAESLAAPAILEFMNLYDGITIALDVTDRVVDMVAEGYDAAIRTGDLTDSSHKVRRLAELAFTVCASPDYLARRGVPLGPGDLADHDIVHWFTRTGRSLWTFVRGGETVDITVTGRLITNSMPSLLAAARDGMGVAALPDFAVGQPLADGSLVPLLGDFTVVGMPIWMTWPDSRIEQRKLRLLVDHLVASFDARRD